VLERLSVRRWSLAAAWSPLIAVTLITCACNIAPTVSGGTRGPNPTPDPVFNIRPALPVVRVGESVLLEVELLGQGTSGVRVTWQTTAPDVASLEAGPAQCNDRCVLATGLREGSTTISAETTISGIHWTTLKVLHVVP
jgi:hypothetical protein